MSEDMHTSIGYELAKRTPISPRCFVCHQPYEILGQVNRMIINGQPYTEITRYLAFLHDKDVISKVPSYQSVRNHGKNHLPVKDLAVRTLIERRAIEAGKDIEQGVENLLTTFAVAETVMHKGFAQLTKDSMDISAKDLLAATKLVHDFTKDQDGSMDAAQALSQLQHIIQAVKETVPAHMMEQILTRIEQLESEQIIDAEIVE